MASIGNGPSYDRRPISATAAAPSSTTPRSNTAPASGPVGDSTASTYDLRTDDLHALWVDPVHGDDGRDGHDRASALRTITAAWEQIPRGTATEGYRIALTAGSYPTDAMPNYWDERSGTTEQR